MANSILKIWLMLSSEQKRNAGVLVVAMLLGAGLETVSIGLVLPLLTTLLRPDEPVTFALLDNMLQRLSFTAEYDILLFLTLLLATLFVSKNFFLAYLALLQAKFVFGIREIISLRIYQKYLSQPYSFYLSRNTANFVHVIQTETTQLATSVISPFLILLTEVMVFICIATFVLLIVSWVNLIAILIPAFGSILFYNVLKTKLKIWGENRYFHETMRIKNIQHGFGGVRDIKILGREKNFLDDFDFHNKRSTRYFINSTVASQVPRMLIETFGVIAVLLLVYQFYLFDLPIEDLFLSLGFFGVALLRLAPSGSRILSSLNRLRYGSITVDTIADQMELVELVNEADQPQASVSTPAAFSKKLEMKSASFCYSDTDDPVLERLNMQIDFGSAVGIVGASGAGKTTLINLFLGLLPLSEGQILADGEPILCSTRRWQRQIGYVSQQVFLLDDTFRKNVAFGVPDYAIDEVRLRSVATMANLDDLVSELEFGMNTNVGERGARLSGGQQQRIGLARALYHKPSLLILDEATSALDKDTENEILSSIASLRGTVTILSVSHRMNAVKNCDVIFEVKNKSLQKIKG